MSDPSNSWPRSAFRFVVKIDGEEMSFQEVSGLDAESQPIEYRHGDSKSFSVIKMPGIKKFGNVTLKRGIFTKDTALWEFCNQTKRNTVEKKKVTISLLDESNVVVMSWILMNAFPVKIQGTDLNATGNEVAVETIEIAHEGLSMEQK